MKSLVKLLVMVRVDKFGVTFMEGNNTATSCTKHYVNNERVERAFTNSAGNDSNFLMMHLRFMQSMQARWQARSQLEFLDLDICKDKRKGAKHVVLTLNTKFMIMYKLEKYEILASQANHLSKSVDSWGWQFRMMMNRWDWQLKMTVDS